MTDTSSTDITVRTIAETRAEMSETIRAIEGRLSPAHLREQVIEQIDEARVTLRGQLKEEISGLEGTVSAAVKSELAEIKNSVLVEIADIKEVLQTEFINARVALRAATIGKVETLARDTAQTTSYVTTGVVKTMRANPVPTALIGLGLAWLLVQRFSSEPRGRALATRTSDPRIAVREGNAPGRYTAGLGPRFDD